MTSLFASKFSVPVYPTDDDDGRTVIPPGGEGFGYGALYNGGGNGIVGSVSPFYSFSPSTEIGDGSVQGLSVRNLATGGKWGMSIGAGATLTYSFLVPGVSKY